MIYSAGTKFLGNELIEECETRYEEEMKDVFEEYGLGIDYWKDLNQKSNPNPILKLEDTAIKMRRTSGRHQIVDIDWVMFPDPGEDISPLEKYKDGDLGYEEDLEDLFRDLNEFTDIANYLEQQGIEIEGIEKNPLNEAAPLYAEIIAKALDDIGLIH